MKLLFFVLLVKCSVFHLNFESNLVFQIFHLCPENLLNLVLKR